MEKKNNLGNLRRAFWKKKNNKNAALRSAISVQRIKLLTKFQVNCVNKRVDSINSFRCLNSFTDM